MPSCQAREAPLEEALHLLLKCVLPSFLSSFARSCVHGTYVVRHPSVSGTKSEPGVDAGELLSSPGLRSRGG